jgi:hypothetical protein
MDLMFTRAKLVPIHTKDNVTWHDMYHDLNIEVDSDQKASHLSEKVIVATFLTDFFSFSSLVFHNLLCVM